MSSTIKKLFKAVIQGKKLIVDKILDGVCINTQDNRGNTALIVACQHNNIKMVEYLLDRGADSNIQDARGNTALAYSLDNHEIVKLLMDPNKGKANPKIKCNLNINPLRLSIIKGNGNLLKLLIRSPEDINNRDTNGRNSLLFEAVGALRIDCSIVLIKSGAIDYNGSAFELFNKGLNYNYIKPISHYSPYLLYLLSYGDSNKLECVKRSILKSDDKSVFEMQKTPYGEVSSLNTFIEQSIKHEDVRCLDFIKSSFDVKFYKIRDPEGNTLLSLAAKNKNRDVAKWIYETVSNELDDKKELIKYFIRKNISDQIAISISFDPQWGNNTDTFKYLYQILTNEYSQAFANYITVNFLLPIFPHKELVTFYAHKFHEVLYICF